MTPTLVELARGKATFIKYQDFQLWYSVKWEREIGSDGTVLRSHFDFPIPVNDAGGGEFLPEDKGLTFLRWIRPHLELLELGRKQKEALDELVRFTEELGLYDSEK